jgi:ATP phosphoribosyltransferase
MQCKKPQFPCITIQTSPPTDRRSFFGLPSFEITQPSDLRGDFFIPEELTMLIREQSDLRLSLPSKGRLAEDTMDFLSDCGLTVYRPNLRQYEAIIPATPGLRVLFQRPADIVVSVREGSVDFGITGLDVVEERKGSLDEILVIHDALNFGQCNLSLAIPETWSDIKNVGMLAQKSAALKRPIRVATKYPELTGKFLKQHRVQHTLITAEGTLETAPSIGYADMICDIVSSGQTLRDNRLVTIPDGTIITSQSVLIANKNSLKQRPEALQAARFLLEFFEAHLRGNENLSIFANMRGDSPEAIANSIFTSCHIPGLQGPTISKVIVRESNENWYAVNIVVQRNMLYQAVTELRSIGGSGVVVTPVKYIFDEEPPRYASLLQALQEIQQ